MRSSAAPDAWNAYDAYSSARKHALGVGNTPEYRATDEHRVPTVTSVGKYLPAHRMDQEPVTECLCVRRHKMAIMFQFVPGNKQPCSAAFSDSVLL